MELEKQLFEMLHELEQNLTNAYETFDENVWDKFLELKEENKKLKEENERLHNQLRRAENEIDDLSNQLIEAIREVGDK
jgi:uncharacterized coiled-coil DUF342 family protein